MRTDAYDYALPPAQVAQEPLADRASSRLMVLDRGSGTWSHGTVRDLPGLLAPGDLLVVNDTRVFPARLRGERAETGGQVELLLLEAPPSAAEAVLPALMRSGFPARTGIRLRLGGGRLEGVLEAVEGQGRVRVRLRAPDSLRAAVEAAGEVPVPPYIRRLAGDARASLDRERYQTVYARPVGAVAAPTAGLHLDEALLRALETRGVGRATVTLHVGPGTFRPVTAEHVEEHRVDPEWYEVPADTAERITAARRAGGRVVAVGTTSVRTLETAARAEGAARAVRAGSGWTDLYIHPPYAFAATDVLLTNFHLPRSSLLMLVSAFCEGRGGGGREWLLAAYREAVREGYRFYSYGDAMVIV